MKFLIGRVLAIVLAASVGGCVDHGIAVPQKPGNPVRVGSASSTPSTKLSVFAGWEGVRPKADQGTADLYSRSFDGLVFYTEMQGPDPYIRKFNRSIKVWFIGAGSERLVPLALMLKEPLELATGLPFRFARNLSESNILVSLASKGAVSTHCFLDRRFNPDGSVFRSVIYIGPNYSRHPMLHCLTEEISQSYGPDNDIDVVRESLWRPTEKETNLGLTWHDAVILRTLYDERLKPGMHRDQAMPLVRQIIREVLEDINR